MEKTRRKLTRLANDDACLSPMPWWDTRNISIFPDREYFFSPPALPMLHLRQFRGCIMARCWNSIFFFNAGFLSRMFMWAQGLEKVEAISSLGTGSKKLLRASFKLKSFQNFRPECKNLKNAKRAFHFYPRHLFYWLIRQQSLDWILKGVLVRISLITFKKYRSTNDNR